MSRTPAHPVLFAGLYWTALLCMAGSPVSAQEPTPAPAAIFMKYCGDCHAHGEMEGSLALDELLQDSDPRTHRPKWVSVWKNLRTQLMPPADQPQPSPEEKQAIMKWIESSVFQLDREHPDPGRVTIRRLNRNEYRNTVRDMLGVDFDTNEAFPADDTGYGFDTIGDVLSLSPLQVEKYLEAARNITAKAVPTSGPHPPTISIYADNFRATDESKRTARSLPFAEKTVVERKQSIEHPGPYEVRLEYRITGAPENTSQKAALIIKLGDMEIQRRTLAWEGNPNQSFSFATTLPKERITLTLQLEEEQPPKEGEKAMTFELRKLDLYGPTDGSHVVYPSGYEKIFFKGPPPADPTERTAYAREVLRRVTDKAFRRPVDEPSLDRLLKLVALFDRPNEPQGFEKGVAEALTAVLASPRFLFRAEMQPEPDNSGKVMPIDEFALASRLSYFLWSSLPDDELYELARAGKLREQLRPQIDRMMADAKFDRFVRSFAGQWLQTRDVETLNVDSRRILRVKDLDEAFRIFNYQLRRSMREETEMLFGYLFKENRSALELLTARYSFLNEQLAKWYGIEGVTGNEMRKVDMPEGSPRGGVLTHASFLIVTSNPTRTSPVKRGLFVLDNFLGAPAPPPPPNVPTLEAAREEKGIKLSMRELMVQHRADPLCASCHARMDPLGLALEEYDAIGRWRNEEAGQPIETAGQLITGEKFANVRELSDVLANQRRSDFYTCLTEKLLTYALGRGVEYYDAPTVEAIVERLHREDGRIRELIYGIVESAPFQLRRGDSNG